MRRTRWIQPQSERRSGRIHTLTYHDLKDVPWKNGGGITRDIAKGLIGDHTAWRISRADVARDGAFSDFAGLMRVLTVVSGAGMMLEHDGGALAADPWVPVRFDGALKITARLNDGPLTDLNLMFDPSLCEGCVTPRKGPIDQTVPRPQQGIIAFHVLSGQPLMNEVSLTTGDTAIFDESDATMRLSDGDAVLEIRLRYRDQSDAIKLCIADR